MEAFLRALLPRLLPQDRTFEIHPFQGKQDLLANLERRLHGYAAWLPADWRIVVVADRDDDECRKLKCQLEEAARRAGLRTPAEAGSDACQLVNRIAIEELEAWYFADWEAVRSAYPRVGAHVTSRAAFRNPDAIAGGTWEAFERVMRKYGYFPAGMAKIEAARAIGGHVDPERATSPSFRAFHRAITAAVA